MDNKRKIQNVLGLRPLSDLVQVNLSTCTCSKGYHHSYHQCSVSIFSRYEQCLSLAKRSPLRGCVTQNSEGKGAIKLGGGGGIFVMKGLTRGLVPTKEGCYSEI